MQRRLWLALAALALMATGALAHTFATRIGTITIVMARTNTGVSNVRAQVISDDGEAAKTVNVLPLLTNAEKIQLRDCYDMTMNALGAAAGLPTPMATP